MFRAQSGLTHLEAVVVMLYSTSTVLPHHELERQKAGIGLSLVGCCGCPSPFHIDGRLQPPGAAGKARRRHFPSAHRQSALERTHLSFVTLVLLIQDS